MSVKTSDRIGTIKPASTARAEVKATSARAEPFPRIRFLKKARMLAGRPPSSKSGPFSNNRQTELKELSNSSSETVMHPLAGSLITAPPFLNPFSTTK